jgi:hypothetical protein
MSSAALSDEGEVVQACDAEHGVVYSVALRLQSRRIRLENGCARAGLIAPAVGLGWGRLAVVAVARQRPADHHDQATGSASTTTTT